MKTKSFSAFKHRNVIWVFNSRRRLISITVAIIILYQFWNVSRTLFSIVRNKSDIPSLHEHYMNGKIEGGLVPTENGFLLNGKPFRIVSGAIHYFRVHPHYWRDRLRKLKALGATAVETYVPWNLHEPQKGLFDFGGGHSDMSPFLDIVKYIKLAQEEDLFVIFRPGPYICSEWDFGGLPSWLLRDPTLSIRTMHQGYIERVDVFFEHLIPLIANLQFTQGNGPIIAVQIENEYGAFGYGNEPRDKAYLVHLRDKMSILGLQSMYFTSDDPTATRDFGAVDGALQTANLQFGPASKFDTLEMLQPGMPKMVTEYWSGWFDHWGEKFHNGLSLAHYNNTLKSIIELQGSVNLYMFHGGTNFGFMNGANSQAGFPFYLPDVTSYDYDAPLSEAGDYTEKYDATKEIIASALPITTRLPDRLAESIKIAYPPVEISSYLSFDDIVKQVPNDLVITHSTVLSMEELPINNDNGQSYGFIVYRKTVNMKAESVLTIQGHIRDFAQVLINGQNQIPPVHSQEDFNKFGSWIPKDGTFILNSWRAPKNVPTGTQVKASMDIVVENLGRVNYGKPHDFNQKKGLWEGPVSIDGDVLFNWTIIPLQFKGSWVRNLQGWKSFTRSNSEGPVVVQGEFVVDATADTFLDMSAWGKGVVFINGFNLGRYWSHLGPQLTLYLPAPLLRVGTNVIIIYEQYQVADSITFTNRPNLGIKKK